MVDKGENCLYRDAGLVLSTMNRKRKIELKLRKKLCTLFKELEFRIESETKLKKSEILGHRFGSKKRFNAAVHKAEEPSKPSAEKDVLKRFYNHKMVMETANYRICELKEKNMAIPSNGK